MKKEMKKMTKRFLILATALFLAAAPVNAQVFIQDDEFEGTLREQRDDFDLGLFVPYEGGDNDQQYTPIGDGLLALSLLGGAYLLSKRKRRE